MEDRQGVPLWAIVVASVLAIVFIDNWLKRRRKGREKRIRAQGERVTQRAVVGVWFVGAVVLFVAFVIWPSVEARHWLVPVEAAWAAFVSAFYDGSREEE